MEIAIPPTTGDLHLRLHRPSRPPSGNDDYFTAELSGCALHAVINVWAYGASGLVALFEKMARNWRGWSGTLEWKSLEGEFGLACTNRAGAVSIEVSLRSGHTPPWRVQATVSPAAGELDAIYAAVQNFFEGKNDTGFEE